MIGVFILLIFAILLQGSITSLPILFIILITAFVYTKRPLLLVFAVLFGLLQDMILLRVIGSSSLFLLVALFVAVLYEKKFEVQTLSFILFFTFFAVFFESLFFGAPNLILRTLLSVFLSALFFFTFSLFFKKNTRGNEAFV